jgi:hypothetical protein
MFGVSKRRGAHDEGNVGAVRGNVNGFTVALQEVQPAGVVAGREHADGLASYNPQCVNGMLGTGVEAFTRPAIDSAMAAGEVGPPRYAPNRRRHEP